MKFIKLNRQSIQLFFQKPLVQIFTIAAILCVLVDSFSRESFPLAVGAVFFNPLIFLYNTLIIAITLTPALFFARRICFYVIVSLLWVIIGITDFILLQFRTTPFTFVDVTMIQSAIGIWDHYLTVWQLILIVLLFSAAVIGCVILFRRTKKLEKPPALRVVKSMILMAACAIVATDLGVALKFLSRNFGNLADAYHSYGLPYCFVNSMFNTGIDKPKKYSEEYVQKIIASIEHTATPIPTPLPTPTLTPMPEKEPERTPNILFLQLESFFDPTSIAGSTFTDDPLPNYRRLMEEFTSGYLYVPSVGAGTANTEFEVITGMNLDFFGPGEYPYKTILLDTACESIGYVLKNRGYGTHAIHNNDGTFYGRHLVFPNLGFDNFISVEYMNPIDRTPLAWAKDKILTGEIAKALDSTKEPDFIYTISVQGHGSYPDKEILTDPVIDLSLPEHLSELYYPLLYYTNQIHEMDDFVAELIEMLENREEETVLVMYGDHLPGFKLTQEDLGGASLFATQYVVWSNFELEPEHKDLEAYQLYSYVLERLNVHDGIINGFHQTQKTSELYLEELEILEYDMLYGKQNCYNGKNPYAPTQMKMGIDPIVLTGIRALGSVLEEEAKEILPEEELKLLPNKENTENENPANPTDSRDENIQDTTLSGTPSPTPPTEKENDSFWSFLSKKDDDQIYTVFLLGSGFTPYSYVQVNGKEQETMFVSDTVLTAVMPLPDIGATITIVQHGSDEQVLSSSEPLIITEQLLKNIFPKENPELEGED